MGVVSGKLRETGESDVIMGEIKKEMFSFFQIVLLTGRKSTSAASTVVAALSFTV